MADWGSSLCLFTAWVAREMNAVDFRLSVNDVGPVIARDLSDLCYGSEAQRQKYLPGFGEWCKLNRLLRSDRADAGFGSGGIENDRRTAVDAGSTTGNENVDSKPRPSRDLLRVLGAKSDAQAAKIRGFISKRDEGSKLRGQRLVGRFSLRNIGQGEIVHGRLSSSLKTLSLPGIV